MASREELAEEALRNEPGFIPPGLPRITVRPEGVAPPPLNDMPWGAPSGEAGRPAGRLFEPDLTPAPEQPFPRPSMVEAVRTQHPLASTRPGLPSFEENLRALPGALGSLVSGAGAYLNQPLQQAPVRPAGGMPSSISGLPPRRAAPQLPPGSTPASQFLGQAALETAQIPHNLIEAGRVINDPASTPQQVEQARAQEGQGVAETGMNLYGFNAPFSVMRKGATAGVFGGRLSKTADLQKQKLAEMMEQNGVPANQIWKETGWMKLPDQRWYNEISDAGAYYKGDVDSVTKRIFDQRFPEKTGQYEKNPLRMNMAREDALLKLQGKAQLKLGDVYHHPKLYEAYPWLRDMPVTHDMHMQASGGYSAAKKQGETGHIFYREDDTKARMARGNTFDTLSHEIMHAIAQVEDFARGSNPSRAIVEGSPVHSIYLKQMEQAPKIMPFEDWQDWQKIYGGKNPKQSAADYSMYRNNMINQIAHHEKQSRAYAGWQAYNRSLGEDVANVIKERKDFDPAQAAAIDPRSQMRNKPEKHIVEFNPPLQAPSPGEKDFSPMSIPQAQMGAILKPVPEGLELPQMSAPSPLLRSPGKTLKEPAWLPVTPKPFVGPEAQRVFSPGIYKDPREIARAAAALTAAEHPAMKELFGVTRDDLWQIGERGTRKGNVDPQLWSPKDPGGSYVAEALMNPANAQRQIDAMVEARKFPALSKGMEAWYVMDPAFQQLVKLVGKERAIEEYRRFNGIMTPFSSNSTVGAEINRGTGARMMADLGRFEDFKKYGGGPVEKRGPDFPPEMRDIAPHLRHSGHIPPVERWLATGEHGYAKETVKNPLYTLASGVPETGFQTKLPVPDAHFARGGGASDVRRDAKPERHMGAGEYRQYGPWFRENVAKPLGLEAVPGQGLMWGTFAPQTGVKTAIGAPKLEILSQQIWERAQKLGIDPKKLRDDVLLGKGHALWLMGAGGAVSAGGGLGSLVAPNRQEVY